MTKIKTTESEIAEAVARTEQCQQSAAVFASALHKLATNHPKAFAEVIGRFEHIEVFTGSSGQISGWAQPGAWMGTHDEGLFNYIENMATFRAQTCNARSR
jgi:hypothetical protein